MGITSNALSIKFMQVEKFVKADRVMKASESEETASFLPTKENIRKGSKEYWRLKALQLEKELNGIRGEGKLILILFMVSFR